MERMEVEQLMETSFQTGRGECGGCKQGDIIILMPSSGEATTQGQNDVNHQGQETIEQQKHKEMSLASSSNMQKVLKRIVSL